MTDPAPSNRSRKVSSDAADRDQFAEVRASWWATGVLAVSAVTGVAIHPLRYVAVAVAVLLFVIGVVLLGVTLVIGANRSRTEVVDVGGLFFTQAPMTLRLLFVAQIVIAFATATLRATASFGVLATLVGLGLCGLWGARHGTYPVREAPDAPPTLKR